MRLVFKLRHTFWAAALLMALCVVAQADSVAQTVIQYHFTGASSLATNKSLKGSQKVFSLQTTSNFVTLAISQLSIDAAQSFQFSTKGTVIPLHDLIQSWMSSESAGTVGGVIGQPLDAVFAVHLTAADQKTWQGNLQKINGGAGQSFSTSGFQGLQWRAASPDSFWAVPARDWLVVGRGKSLDAVRTEYLNNIQSRNAPTTSLGSNVFEANIDWPTLANWVDFSKFPLRLAKTKISMDVEYESFHMTAKAEYNKPIAWERESWKLPSELVREPLTSFSVGRGIKPLLAADFRLGDFITSPLRDQFCFWSQGEMAFQSYLVWPALDPTNKMILAGVEALHQFNAGLKSMGNSSLVWNPKISQLAWSNLPIITPTVFPAPKTNGDFLVASLFALTPGRGPVPNSLLAQFNDQSDVMYYDWELTGPRVRSLLTVFQVLPLLKIFGVEAPNVVEPSTMSQILGIQENWLLGMVPFLSNTVTIVTKTGTNEVTVVRNSPLVFSSFELIYLAHMLTKSPAGPVDWSLLPHAELRGPATINGK